MLKKAETTSQINTEVHLFGAINQHIVMIERVVNTGFELVGLLHLSLDISLFDELLQGVALDDGYAELTQRAAGKTLILAKTGNVAQRQGAATTVSVNDTRWIIAYWSGSGSIILDDGTVASDMPLLLIILVLLIGAGAVYFVVMKKGTSSTEAGDDLLTYEGAVRAIAEGAHAGVEQLIPHLPKADRITANLKPLSQGINTDDATMIATPPPSEPKQQSLRQVSQPIQLISLLSQKKRQHQTKQIRHKLPR